MATITLSSPTFFQNGTSGVSSVIGYANHANRVARYSFVSPSTGASSVSLAIAGLVYGDGTRPTTFLFYIGTNPNSHISAGAGSTYTGILNLDTSTKVDFYGSANIMLSPSTTYYLFVFPNTTEYGWFSAELASTSMTSYGGSVSKPTLSTDTAVMGSRVTIYTNRFSTDFTHILTYSFGGVTGTIATDATDYYYWSPPLELAKQIPYSDIGVGTIYCTTKDAYGNTVGSAQAVTIYLTVPESVTPSASLTWKDSSGAYDKMGVLVQRVSKLAVDVSGTGAYGSQIVSANVTLGGYEYLGGIIYSSGTLSLVGTVTDSRGRTGSYTTSVTIAPYSVPQLSLNASRCTEDGTADDTGEFAKVTITGSTTQVNGSNTASLTFNFGDGSEPVTVGEDFTYSYIISAPSTYSMYLEATLSDVLLKAKRNMTLSTGYATMDFLDGGKGIAFGASATKEGFTCAMDADFTGDVSLSDSATKRILDKIYPINSIYISYSHTSPAELFGGEWTRIVDRFLWGTGPGGAIGYTDGEAKHTLTTNEIPSHQHFYNNLYNGYPLAEYRTGSGQYYAPLYDNQSGNESSNAYSNTGTTKTGGGASHNNMPPYIQVSIWRRTA